MLCLVEIGPVVLWKILKYWWLIFAILILSPLAKGCGSSFEQTWHRASFSDGNSSFFIWTNLNSHHPRMLCAKLRWNWSNGSWRRFIYLVSINYFCYFRVDFINCQYDIFSLYVAIEIVSPHRTGRGFHLNKFYFPSPRMLCAEFLYVSIIFANFLLSRLGKGCDHSCEQTWTNLITHWRFMPNLVQIDLIVLEMTKMWKV